MKKLALSAAVSILVASSSAHAEDRAPKPHAQLVTGAVLTTTSVALLVGSAIMLGVFAQNKMESFGTDTALLYGSIASLGASFATGIPGIVLLVNGSRASDVQGDLRAATIAQPVPRVPAFTFPLLRASF